MGRFCITIAALCSAVVLLPHCSPQFLREPIRLHKSGRSQAGEDLAHIAKVDFRPSNGKSAGPIHMRRLRAAIRTALLNTGRFSRVVLLQGKGAKRDPGALTFDVTVFSNDAGEFEWWITWPAVYPMPGYWPIQKKKGVVNARIEVVAYKGGQKVFAKTFAAERDYEIDIYGFYRTSPIERRMRECYEETLEALTEAVAQSAFTPVPETPAK